MIRLIPVPTPFAVGEVNCYLVEDDPLTLVDTGPDLGTSLAALEAGLAEHGRKVEDLERIVLTHHHIDHVGLAATLAERSGAEVCAIAPLAPWMERWHESIDADDRFGEELMLRHGVPEEQAAAVRKLSASFHDWGRNVRIDRPLEDGGALEFAGRTWKVLHRPGHSPSDTLFFDEASGELIGGDHLLKSISSNALVQLPLDGRASAVDRPRPLLSFINSLKATREMDVRIVYGGHRGPIDDHRSVIDERMRGYERRARKISRLLEERPKTAFELTQDMWGNVAVTQTYLTLSEVLGHIDLLIERGQAREIVDEDFVRYATAD